MIHLVIQKRSGKILEIMKVMSQTYQTSLGGKKSKKLKMQLRITVLKLGSTQKESHLVIQKSLLSLGSLT